LASLFHWVSGIKEAYKGLLDGDILVGLNNNAFKAYKSID